MLFNGEQKYFLNKLGLYYIIKNLQILSNKLFVYFDFYLNINIKHFPY